MTEMNTMDILEVMEHLPHRYPFLLVDKVVDYTLGERLVALKNVTINEPFFQGHFPQKPVMPGVLLMEAMAQATGILAFKTANQKPTDGVLYYFAGIDNARFKQPVVPGDTLIFEVEIVKLKAGIGKFHCKATVDGNLVCEADLMCAKREI
ncbi:3-hydroxyacyl-ACP dehydratase FabZ [Gallaecimonas mangrovi]|uniref:3-hydroxyacyl-ACP dehydratase FabZ n=1 Tax=Gallaecimonas mangrovi TaxID=2291597 RepID=UPI001869621B|nr:3-hydroxyacyl-ACP dehydratase FabZ [Gallaecimonas mangrovi]